MANRIITIDEAAKRINNSMVRVFDKYNLTKRQRRRFILKLAQSLMRSPQ